ncbi:putative amidohydrolase [Friedmanniella endophytica]|uniref:Putative amidohydrolase n=1 Tax=Microlunatus kandeliicorticis TaxID=1759536 RepID=A0A7W3IT51_9ACTN|nr:carbon-nitrogen hydrolase family protein [Microlunatus kandeliicorticis]MBA8794783.1 putative amidohydrolase [Microlunatus kandeliicorticis]
MSLTVAVCQFAAGADVAANTEACRDLIATATARGAELAVLPEAAMYYEPSRRRVDRPRGEHLDGAFGTAISEAAKADGIAVVAGMSELVTDADDDRDLNTLLAVSATGERLGAYRKLHLYDAFGVRESDTLRPGRIEQPTVIDVGGVAVGLLTCYDLRFPEAFRWVVDAGAELVVVPSAWAVGPAKEDHWRTLIKARAIENTVYVAAAGQTGPVSCGLSMIVDPTGAELAGAGLTPGVATAIVDPQRIAAVRETNPSLRNRRFAITPR